MKPLTIPQLKKLQRENNREFKWGLDAYSGEVLKPDADEELLLVTVLLMSWCEMNGEILKEKIAARRRKKKEEQQ
jgi:hypothetical protein